MEYANNLALILVESSQESKGKGRRICNEELAQDIDREDHDDAVEANSVAGPSARAGAGNFYTNNHNRLPVPGRLYGAILLTGTAASFLSFC